MITSKYKKLIKPLSITLTKKYCVKILSKGVLASLEKSIAESYCEIKHPISFIYNESTAYYDNGRLMTTLILNMKNYKLSIQREILDNYKFAALYCTPRMHDIKKGDTRVFYE